MAYSINEIKRRIEPVAKKHHLREVFLFGSYARGEAEEDSDVDLLVDTAPDSLGLFQLTGLAMDFEAALGLKVDVVTLGGFQNVRATGSDFLDREQRRFRANVNRERVRVYENI